MAKLVGGTKIEDGVVVQPIEASEEQTTPIGPLESAKLETFEDLTAQAQVIIQSQDMADYNNDHRMVEVRVRENIPRTCICGRWYTFSKGKPASVPKYVKDWLDTQGVL